MFLPSPMEARTRGAMKYLKPQSPEITPLKQPEEEPAGKPSQLVGTRLIKKIYECDLLTL